MICLLQIGDGTRRTVPVSAKSPEIAKEAVVAWLDQNSWLELMVNNGRDKEYVRSGSVVSFEIRER